MSDDLEQIRKKIEELEGKVKELPVKEARITELETAVTNTTKANEDLKKNQDKAIKDAVDDAKKTLSLNIAKQLGEIVVPASIESRFKQVSAKLLNTDVKRLKRRLENESMEKP